MPEILQGRKFKCAFCGGSGIQPRSLKSRCLACRGKGEVEFEGPAIQCFACRGKGRATPSSMLSCVHCRGVGVVEKSERDGDVAETIGERLGEITKRLQWTRKETEKKTKEIERRLKPIRPFVKEVEKESLLWLNKLGNKIKRGWQSLWED
jgi:RecJ-like exonuclease